MSCIWGQKQEIEHGCRPFNIILASWFAPLNFAILHIYFPLFTMSPSKNTVYTRNNHASKVAISKVIVL